MKTKDLQVILAAHKEWLLGDTGERANLSGANLSGANLRRTDLSGATGVLHPPVNDPRGYRCVAVWFAGQWAIAAGCRWLSLPEAQKHWGPDYGGDRAIGDAYLAAVEWAAQQPGPASERSE